MHVSLYRSTYITRNGGRHKWPESCPSYADIPFVRSAILRIRGSAIMADAATLCAGTTCAAEVSRAVRDLEKYAAASPTRYK